MATVCTPGLLQLVFAQVCKALGEGVKTQLFSRGEGDPRSSPPNSVVQSWDRRRPRWGQGRSGGLCAPDVDLGGGLYTLGAVGERPDPIPRVRSLAGGMRRGVGTGPHPWAPEVSTRSDAHP